MDKSITGQLTYLSITEVVGVIAQSAMSGVLTIRTADGVEGTLCFDSGRLVHVNLLDFIGNEALGHILTWKEGEFNFFIGPYEGDVTITESFDKISLDHLKREDEEIAEVGQPISGTSKIMLAKSNSPSDSLELDPIEWTFLLQIGEGCSLAQAIAELGISSAEGKKIVFKLLKLELITISAK